MRKCFSALFSEIHAFSADFEGEGYRVQITDYNCLAG
jgi:hypothetical protein